MFAAWRPHGAEDGTDDSAANAHEGDHDDEPADRHRLRHRDSATRLAAFHITGVHRGPWPVKQQQQQHVHHETLYYIDNRIKRVSLSLLNSLQAQVYYTRPYSERRGRKKKKKKKKRSKYPSRYIATRKRGGRKEKNLFFSSRGRRRKTAPVFSSCRKNLNPKDSLPWNL